MPVARMLESEDADDGPHPSYSSSAFQYGSVDRTSVPDHSPYMAYRRQSSTGTTMTSDSNAAASHRALAERATGSATGSIFREHFDGNTLDGGGNGYPPSPTTPIDHRVSSNTGVNEPLMRYQSHDRYSTTSSTVAGLLRRSPSPASAHRGSLVFRNPSDLGPSSYTALPFQPQTHYYPQNNHVSRSRTAPAGNSPPLPWVNRNPRSSTTSIISPPVVATNDDRYYERTESTGHSAGGFVTINPFLGIPPRQPAPPPPPAQFTYPIHPTHSSSNHSISPDGTRESDPYQFLPDSQGAYILPELSLGSRIGSPRTVESAKTDESTRR